MKAERCLKHPKYIAQKMPTSACKTCWKKWTTRKIKNKPIESKYRTI